jgi:hypothetical protein
LDKLSADLKAFHRDAAAALLERFVELAPPD